jgi:recombination protein RecA
MSSTADALRTQIESALANRFPGALTMRPQFQPEMVSVGIPALHSRIGIPQGCLTEICGPVSSGKTTLVLSCISEMTQRGECCAWIDASGAFNPYSAAANGVILERLLVVRCAAPHPNLTPVDKAVRAVDMVVHEGGFAMIVLDLADIAPRLAQRIPLSYWYRFRRAAEKTSSCFVVMEQQPVAKSCASQVIRLETHSSEWATTRNHASSPKLLTGVRFAAHVSHSRHALTERKAPTHAVTEFRIPTSWAG